MFCKDCACWIDQENNPTEDEEYGVIDAIATCDSESIYGKLQTKANFGCVLFRPAQRWSSPAS